MEGKCLTVSVNQLKSSRSSLMVCATQKCNACGNVCVVISWDAPKYTHRHKIKTTNKHNAYTLGIGVAGACSDFCCNVSFFDQWGFGWRSDRAFIKDVGRRQTVSHKSLLLCWESRWEGVNVEVWSNEEGFESPQAKQKQMRNRTCSPTISPSLSESTNRKM